MDVRATRRGVPAVVFWGGLGVFAWATLTVLLGGGSAHADDQEDGPLGGLTSLVSNTVSAVTAPVAPIVTQVVAPVVTQVVTPVQQTVPTVVATVTQPIAEAPVVGPVTAPVVHAVTETTSSVVNPVRDLLTDSPVSQLTDPLLGAVADIPVVGGLVSDLGLISAVGDVVGVVDDTTALLGKVTDETVPPVLDALDPTTPADPEGPEGTEGNEGFTDPSLQPHHDVIDGVVADEGTATAVTIASFTTAGSSFPAARSGALSPGYAAAHLGDDTTPVPTGPPSGSPPGAPVPSSSSAGSGGGSGAAHARLSDVDSSPLRAGERTSGASDDVLPSSPVADTDVSPD